jgi:hypothetical protein
MNRVKISHNNNYEGRDIQWTEEFTGQEKVEAGRIFYHSSRSYIDVFAPEMTCFFENKIARYWFVYTIVIKNDIVVDTYGDEVRIDLEKNRNNVEIYYIGELDYTRKRETEFPHDWKYKYSIKLKKMYQRK